jgi:hypothetical protein
MRKDVFSRMPEDRNPRARTRRPRGTRNKQVCVMSNGEGERKRGGICDNDVAAVLLPPA